MNDFLPVSKKGQKPPKLAVVPRHVAIVMDGNGRWANARGLTRIEGHKAGEAALLDVVAGAIEAGVEELTVFAFSTENWKRSPEEVRFLMGFNREVLRSRRDQLNHWGVKIRWAGREPKLLSSVIRELESAEDLTKRNKVLTLTMCVNYGSRIEILDAINEITQKVAKKEIRPGSIAEKNFGKFLTTKGLRDVDLFIRSSGEKRLSNFLLWQSAYAELVFSDVLWPDFDRRELWRALQEYSGRQRRFGGAVDSPKRAQAK
ncbi:MAG: polyprenyl diphosphate synthase [Actinomycetota bacterium]